MSVTILIPVYNGATLLPRSLTSISAQTYGDWRVVIGDDGSTDESAAVIERSGLPRVTVRRNGRNIGWAQTVNLLLAEVDSDYVAVLHQDDWWEPTFLATVTALLDRSPASLLAVTATRAVHPSRPEAIWGLHQGWPAEKGSTCPSSVAVSLLLPANLVRCPAVLARSELYRRYSYDESLPYACDWLMWLRAAAMASVEVSGDVLANFQLHEASQTTGFARANLTTIDMLRMVEVLRSEWAVAREPVNDAIAKLTAGITNEILADAGLKIEAGDLAGAEVQLRYARAIAPSVRQLLMSLAGQTAVELLRLPALAGLRTPVTQLGRRLW
jgi:glycosyltransferase involved in cell wall biosynthesis